VVTELVMRVGVWALVSLAGLLHLPDVPSWLSGAGASISSLGSYLTGLGGWIPWAVIAGVITTWVVVLGASVGIKLVRLAWSYVPFVGGAG
jgi:hypothetical protein